MAIGITMGDAGGIGPELVLRAHQDNSLPGDYVVIGDFEILSYCNMVLKTGAVLYRMQDISDKKPGVLNVYDLGLMQQEELQVGRISRKSGYAARRYVETATHLTLQGEIDAMVTLPINKEAVRLSDPHFTGHTELIAGICRETDYTMMLASDKLIVTHVSTHVSMEKAVEAVKKDRILKVICLTHEALAAYMERPRIAVAGLNPHAGENGAFGLEEMEEIVPAILQAQALGIDARGPEAPDTVFLKTVQGVHDAVVCMYHDQGHIPIKLLDFESGVNITLGLQVIRTSVDHGTAFDIAYQGIASPKSLVSACRFAIKLLGQK